MLSETYCLNYFSILTLHLVLSFILSNIKKYNKKLPTKKSKIYVILYILLTTQTIALLSWLWPFATFTILFYNEIRTFYWKLFWSFNLCLFLIIHSSSKNKGKKNKYILISNIFKSLGRKLRRTNNSFYNNILFHSVT